MPRRPYVAHPPALASTIKERTESPILRPPGVIVEDDIELGASRLRRRRLAAPSRSVGLRRGFRLDREVDDVGTVDDARAAKRVEMKCLVRATQILSVSNRCSQSCIRSYHGPVRRACRRRPSGLERPELSLTAAPKPSQPD
jgi:hypothetical protein